MFLCHVIPSVQNDVDCFTNTAQMYLNLMKLVGLAPVPAIAKPHHSLSYINEQKRISGRTPYKKIFLCQHHYGGRGAGTKLI